MDRLMDVSGVHYDRGVYPKGFARHFSALLASPGRAKALTKLRIPTLVVHGEKDPLVPPWAGRMLAATIPGARFEFIADMGHDLSPSLWPHVVEAITANAHRPAPMGPLSVEQTIRALTMSASPVAVPER
jgi:pimeloyl-ACP methyl ester carboxylesterase